MHEECGTYIGGCARFACANAATPRTRMLELIHLRHRTELQSWTGFAVFSAVLLLELNLSGQLHSLLGALATACLVVSAGLAALARRATDRVANAAITREYLVRLVEAGRGSRGASSGHRSGVAVMCIGLGYLLVRVVWWRGVWPLVVGLVFASGCAAYGYFISRADRLRAQLSGLAACWADELSETIAERADRPLIEIGDVRDAEVVKKQPPQ